MGATSTKKDFLGKKGHTIRVVQLFILLCFINLQTQASWQVYARNTASSKQNTQLYFNSSSHLDASIHLGFRQVGTRSFLFQDQFILQAPDDQPTIRLYHLPTGKYELEITIMDSAVYELELSHEVLNREAPVFVSDIFLDHQAFSKLPVPERHFPQLSANQQSLFFRADVLASQFSQLTTRAVLYIENAQSAADKAQVFTSIQQQNEILNFTSKLASLTGEFQVADLAAGDYLLEIIVYEDDRLLAERSVRFQVAWKGFEVLKKNPLEAIDMLDPICDSKSLIRLKQQAEKEDAYRILEAWWRSYAPEAPLISMRQYYTKITAAAAELSETLPVWQSDRGKAYILYGKPNKRETVQRETYPMQFYERWYYEEWNLTLWFKKEGTTYIRIK